MINRAEMTVEDEKLFNAAWVEVMKTRPIDPSAFLAGWQAARANPVPASDLEADAIAWRTLLANSEGAYVYRIGSVTLLNSIRKYDGAQGNFGPRETFQFEQHPIVQAAFQWVNRGDCPTLRDGLLALAKGHEKQD